MLRSLQYSRGPRGLADWFDSAYCKRNKICRTNRRPSYKKVSKKRIARPLTAKSVRRGSYSASFAANELEQ